MSTPNRSIAEILKEARKLKSLSLREVENHSGISNAYLSQIENGKIKNPSASILYKLAAFYKIDFSYLLQATHIVEVKNGNTKAAKINHYAFSSDNLTAEEEQALISYLKFIRSQGNK